MKKQRKRIPLVVEHLEGIARAAIGRFPELVTEFARGKSGVYALYKGASLYYVGLAKNLRSRLHHHLRDRHAEEWNRFSTSSVGAYNHTPHNDRLIKPHEGRNIFRPYEIFCES
jgi:hypothetical protein